MPDSMRARDVAVEIVTHHPTFSSGSASQRPRAPQRSNAALGLPRDDGLDLRGVFEALRRTALVEELTALRLPHSGSVQGSTDLPRVRSSANARARFIVGEDEMCLQGSRNRRPRVNHCRAP